MHVTAVIKAININPSHTFFQVSVEHSGTDFRIDMKDCAARLLAYAVLHSLI